MECRGKSAIETHAHVAANNLQPIFFVNRPICSLATGGVFPVTPVLELHGKVSTIQHVGRWKSINAFENFYNGTIKADAKRDIIYMPTQWAGVLLVQLEGSCLSHEPDPAAWGQIHVAASIQILC